MNNNWADKFYKYSDDVFKDKTITHFEDGSGYSLIGEYKEGFKRRMGVKKNGQQVPFFKFIFDKDYKFEDSKYAPLSINVGLTTRVEENSEVRYMLNNSGIKHLRPIDLYSIDEFYIGQNDGKVYEKKGEKFSKVGLSTLYDRLYNVHTSDILTPKGAYRRIKLFILRKLPSYLLSAVAWALGWLTYYIKKDRYVYDVITERYLNRQGDRQEVALTTSTESDINFFGYKVSLWTLYTYSLIAIIIYIFREKQLNNLVTKNGIGNTIVIIFTIFTIITYDIIIPYLLRFVIRFSSSNSYDLKYKGIKLKI